MYAYTILLYHSLLSKCIWIYSTYLHWDILVSPNLQWARQLKVKAPLAGSKPFSLNLSKKPFQFEPLSPRHARSAPNVVVVRVLLERTPPYELAGGHLSAAAALFASEPNLDPEETRAILHRLPTKSTTAAGDRG